ncbi:MAG TPA: hypothetical protein EYP63_03795 [Desulfotomaculum sp.]|nr:hypothetical protein [Desulfotomaculum sp.]
MALTRRRKDFLAMLIQRYEQRRRPVHYTDVASDLKVSRWTAYDILRRLEQDGYLEAVYETGRKEGGPGRALVLYRPTRKKDPARRESAEDWPALRGRLLNLLKEKRQRAREIVGELLHELPEIKGRLAKSAYNLAVLIAHLGEMSTSGRKFLSEIIARARHPEEGLSLFTGAAIGALLGGAVSGPVERCIKRLQRQVAELEPGEVHFLASFLKEALER